MQRHVPKCNTSQKSGTSGIKKKEVIIQTKPFDSTTDSDILDDHEKENVTITKKKKLTKYIQGSKGRKFHPVKGIIIKLFILIYRFIHNINH